MQARKELQDGVGGWFYMIITFSTVNCPFRLFKNDSILLVFGYLKVIYTFWKQRKFKVCKFVLRKLKTPVQAGTGLI